MTGPARRVVMLLASRDTQNALHAWAQVRGFDLTQSYSGNAQPAENFDFHTTLVASVNAVFMPNTQHQIEPFEVDAIGFDVLGADRDVPVLKLAASTELSVMRQFFVEAYGMEPTFPEFKPHVSLSYAWDGTPALEVLPLPAFPLTFDQLVVRSIDDGSKTAIGAHFYYR